MAYGSTIPLVGGSTLLLGPMQAFAAVPEAATTALTTATTDAGTMIDGVWPLVVAVAVGFLLLKLFKRGISKA